MQHLTPVGLSQDGKRLVLVSDTGEEFAVPVDHRFRTALRGESARPGQLEMKMESALRPRDIQARIRAGESAEDVATAAGTTVDGIMAFAGPVLAERAHVAQTAVKCSIRRSSADSSPVGRTLDEASRQHFSTTGVRADDVEWDAWRREDGRWSLVARYEAAGTPHRAEFSYDQPGRYVVAVDDEARLLTGESVAAPAAAAAEPPGRRLSAVRDDDELPLGDDALELVRERPGQPAEADVSTTDLTDTAAAIRDADRETARTSAAPDTPGDEPATFDDLAVDHADADWMIDAPAGRSSETLPFEEPPADPQVEPQLDAQDEPQVDSPAEPQVESPADPEPTPTTDPTDVEEAPTPERPRKKGRSSVPSWDEIMFGGGKHE